MLRLIVFRELAEYICVMHTISLISAATRPQFVLSCFDPFGLQIETRALQPNSFIASLATGNFQQLATVFRVATFEWRVVGVMSGVNAIELTKKKCARHSQRKRPAPILCQCFASILSDAKQAVCASAQSAPPAV